MKSSSERHRGPARVEGRQVMPMTKPSRCQCGGCLRCSPERGRCERPAGDYPGEYYCEDCHQEAARVMFDAQPQTNMSGMDAVLAAWSHRFRLQWTVVGDVRLPRPGGHADVVFQPAQPELIIPAGILVLGDEVDEGQLIESVAFPWFEFIKELERNPDFLHQLDWRKDWRKVE